VLAVLTKIGAIHIPDFFRSALWIFRHFRYIVLKGLVLSIVTTNFILLPFINIGLVVRKSFAKKVEGFVPRIFPGVSRMNLRERVVRMACSLILVSSFGHATLIEPNTLRVEEVEILSDKVSEDVTILHLTDMHIDSIGKYEQKLFRRIQQLNPDIIVQTGDLLDLYGPEQRDEEMMRKLAGLFKQLRPKYGTYWVVGNHDYGLGKSDCL